jgi:hypothetical protein
MICSWLSTYALVIALFVWSAVSRNDAGRTFTWEQWELALLGSGPAIIREDLPSVKSSLFSCSISPERSSVLRYISDTLLICAYLRNSSSGFGFLRVLYAISCTS